jgi:ankyrin repeat protein
MTQLPEKTELGLLPRLIAAGWFACAACIPIIFFFGVIGRVFFFGPSAATDPMVASTYILLPISMAAFLGFSVGSRILNDRIVKRGWSAVIHGALVAILSYFGFIFGYAAIVWLATFREPLDIISSFLRVFFLGAVLVGWLIVLAGAFSGWLLFRVGRNRLGARLSTATKRSRSRYLNLWAAIMLFAVLFACWLPTRKEAQRENAETSQRDLNDAVWHNDPTRVEELLARGLPVETKDVAGSTLLLTAAEKGHTRIVRILLDHGANPNVTTDRYGHRTPLLWAVVNADADSIRALLEHGANVNTADDYGGTPLMEAAWATDKETVKLLIERGADVNYKTRDGQTPLSMAKLRRDSTPSKLDRVEETINRQGIDAGQNVIDSRDFQNPAIMKRARERHDAIIALLKSYGVK